ncbi:MAG: RnfABCDGE type electron transport complex subunit D [Clostridia bacterium]|nr:RnfABCDGE type electron transport complex subunit D [Clostridia bacterium]
MPERLTVAASPHEKTRTHVPHLMRDVLIALLPACLFGILWFGPRAALLCGISVLTCILAELLYEKLLRRPVTVRDGSAAVTGLLLAMNLPYTMPIPMLLLADVFAIILVKQIFGGLGKNIVNPALAARVFLFMSFPGAMANFSARPDFGASYTDAVTSATTLTSLKEGLGGSFTITDLFFGTTPGCIGEVSALLLLVGGVYLLCRRVITWHIPVSYLGTVALLTFLIPRTGDRMESMLLELCAGGLLLGAFFMATDYVTSPVTRGGRLIYGVLCGAITVFIRYCGVYAEGVSFAILIGNLLVYYLDRFTRPTPFGKRRGKR